MNLYRIARWNVWTTIAICLVSVLFQLYNALVNPGWWWLAVAPVIFVPNIINWFIRRKAWKSATYRAVFAALSRPITEKEKTRLTRRSYQVDNMYVSGIKPGPGPADAALRMYDDLTRCMDTEFGVEEITTRDVGTARRVWDQT